MQAPVIRSVRKRIINSVAISLFVLLASLAVWSALVRREQNQIREATQLTAQNLSTRIRSELGTRFRPLQSMAEYWEVSPWHPSRGDWEAYAHLFQRAFVGYEAIAWVDASRTARWWMPNDSAEFSPALTSILKTLPLASAEKRTAEQDSISATTIDPPDGLGHQAAPIDFAAFTPVSYGRHADGFIVGLFQLAELVGPSVAEALPAGYRMALVEDGRTLYSWPENAGAIPGDAAFREAGAYGLPWHVRVWPSEIEGGPGKVRLPVVVLVFGTILGVLLGITLFFFETATHRARVLEEAKTSLEGRTSELGGYIEALRHANETLNAVIDASPLAIIAMDLEGRVKRWNRAAQETFQWTEEEVLNRKMPIVPEDDMPFFQENMRKVQLGQTLKGVERRRQRKDGSLIEVAFWTAIQRDAAGHPVGIISVIADVSARKALEEQLRQAQKMEAVGRIAGGVAHFFNNLMMIIAGYGRVVLSKLRPETEIFKQIEEILKAANRAADITNNLLAFSGRQTAEPEVTDLNLIVQNVSQLFRGLVGERVEVETRLSPDLGKVWIDPSQVEHVLISLAVNAREAMPQGGTLTLRTYSVRLPVTTAGEPLELPAGNYSVLEISDTGKGMDAETRQHVFEPFFTTKGFSTATGLSLSSVFGIVRQNKGDISVATEVGRGTTFRIFLPEYIGRGKS